MLQLQPINSITNLTEKKYFISDILWEIDSANTDCSSSYNMDDTYDEMAKQILNLPTKVTLDAFNNIHQELFQCKITKETLDLINTTLAGAI